MTRHCTLRRVTWESNHIELLDPSGQKMIVMGGEEAAL